MFHRHRILLIVVLVLVLLFGLWCFYGWWAIRGIESPAYTVEKSGDVYELRHYDSMIVATTTVTGDYDASLNEGFRRIAAYIFGDNTLQQEIAMTTPVTTESNSQSISMTTPVISTQSTEDYEISFVMPAQYTMDSLPLPNDSRVRIELLPTRTIGVLCFSGLTPESRVLEKKQELLEALSADALETVGTPSMAYYNPPFTPFFMRKNEVWIEIKE